MDDIFKPENEAKSQWVSWGKEGDWFKGTLTAVKKFKDSEGKDRVAYEFMAQDGEFHNLDKNKMPIEPPVKVVKGDYWLVGSRKTFEANMNRVQLGQICGFRFAETKPSTKKNYSDLKIIKLYVAGMDPEYKGQSSSDTELSLPEL